MNPLDHLLVETCPRVISDIREEQAHLPEPLSPRDWITLLRLRLVRILPTAIRPVPYPGLIAHHRGTDHAHRFREATQELGRDASTYFRRAGITACAKRNGGLCTFWLGSQLSFYQITNEPLVSDDDLAPSIESNASLFGDFMGALPSNDPERKAKRAVVERVLGSMRFVTALEPSLRTAVRERLQNNAGKGSVALSFVR